MVAVTQEVSLPQKEGKISSILEENVTYVDRLLGKGESFDVLSKRYVVDTTKMMVYGLNGLSTAMPNISVLVGVLRAAWDEQDHSPKSAQRILEERFSYLQVEATDDMEKAIDAILSGPIVLFIDGSRQALIIDIRQYPARDPSEPPNEKVIRGPQDGFTETLVTNTALLRRRLQTPGLRLEMHHVGRRSKTNIALAYLRDVTNPDLIERVRRRLDAIDIDALPYGEHALVELLMPGHRWHLFPPVRYTQRADLAASMLNQGYVVLFIDTMPEAVILPANLSLLLDHPEDWHLSPLLGTLMRWVSLLAIFISIFLPAIYLLFTLEHDLIPPWLAWLGPKQHGRIPMALQFLIAEFGIGLLRRALLNSPQPLATAISVVAAILFGQLATTVGLFSPEALLYATVAALGSFATPATELGAANRVSRILLVLLVWAWHLPGLILGILILVILAYSTRPLGYPFLWPIAPFDGQGLLSILIRIPAGQKHDRPSILRPLDPDRRAS